MKEVFAKFFEFGGGFTGLAANDLYEYAYTQLGFMMIPTVLLFVLGYYKFFDSPRFHRWWHWAIVLSSSVIFMLVIALSYIIGVFNREGLSYSVVDYTEFLIALALYTGLLFFLMSLIMKKFSINRRKTPW